MFFLPTTNGETFKIGKIISTPETPSNTSKLCYFDNGCWLSADPEYFNYILLILDGNESTGIDHDFGTWYGTMGGGISFTYPLNVNNITFKPYFGGAASNYSCGINYGSSGPGIKGTGEQHSEQITIEINGYITGFSFKIYPTENGGRRSSNKTRYTYDDTQFNFNDIIINYTPSSSEQKQTKNDPQIFDIGEKIESDIDRLDSDIIKYYPFTSEAFFSVT